MQDDDKEDGRPDPKDSNITFRVDPDTYDKAHKRADREGRKLSKILRAWLMMWAEDEAPSPPVIDAEDKRAAKRKRKK